MGKLIPKLLTIAGTFAMVSASAQQQTQQPQSQHPLGYDQGHQVQKSQMLAGYNIPGRVDVQGGWDFFIKGSFIYWQPLEEGLMLTMTRPTQAGINVFVPNINGHGVYIEPDYKPGFKVGLGMNFNYDDWDAYVKYTRIHGTQDESEVAPPGGALYPNWLHTLQDDFIAANAIGSWKLNTDLLDIELARTYYVGKKLLFRTHFGARAAWIDQRFNANYQSQVSGLTAFSNTNTDSWGLGPRAGIDSNWMLGMGFRGIGNAAASVIYTRYKFSHDETDFATIQDAPVFAESVKRSYLRPNAEFALGLGWGSYLDKKAWHIDLAAAYEFHVFWNQNFMRTILEDTGFLGATMNDLFYHGLSVTAQLDF